jgi:hypothetical protein
MNLELNRHPETDLLIQTLRAVPLGGEISYRTLSEAIGRDVRTVARGRLTSARNIAQRDHGVCFFAQRGQGLRRITIEEMPQVGEHARRRIRSTTRGALKTITAVVSTANGASPETMRRISAERAVLGLLQEAAADPVQKAYEGGETPMPPAHAAAAFLRHIGALDVPGAP